MFLFVFFFHSIACMRALVQFSTFCFLFLMYTSTFSLIFYGPFHL